jgi:hypothetical protein
MEEEEEERIREEEVERRRGVGQGVWVGLVCCVSAYQRVFTSGKYHGFHWGKAR